MKPKPIDSYSVDQGADVEGKPDMAALDAFTRKIIKVPKAELDSRLNDEQKQKRKP